MDFRVVESEQAGPIVAMILVRRFTAPIVPDGLLAPTDDPALVSTQMQVQMQMQVGTGLSLGQLALARSRWRILR